MTAAYTITIFTDASAMIAYCQNNALLPTGKLVTVYYSPKDGHVVVQSV